MIKTVKSDSPTPADLASLRHEYDVLKDLHIDGVVQAVQLESFDSGLALVLADFEDGRTLRQVRSADYYVSGLLLPLLVCVAARVTITTIIARRSSTSDGCRWTSCSA